MNDFDKLCENFGVIKQTKRMLYPKQIKLSEEFIASLKKEYYRLTLEEDINTPVRNRPEKFIKALQFHVKDLEENKEAELETLRNMMDEDTNEYEVKVEDEKEEGFQKVNNKKEQQRRKEVEKENMEPIKESSTRPGFYKFLQNKYGNKVKFITFKSKHLDEYMQMNPEALAPEDINYINNNVIGKKWRDVIVSPKRMPKEEPEYGDAPGDDAYRAWRKYNRDRDRPGMVDRFRKR